MTIFLPLLLMGFFASAASFFLKKSTAGGLAIWKIVSNSYFYLGGTLYVFSALLNFYLLRKLPYSIVVPLGSLTYIWTLGIAHWFLGENITKRKLLGILLILIGVMLVASVQT